MKNVSVIQANITISLLRENRGIFIKAFLSVTPCYLFLYVNGMMIFTLQRRTTFMDKPRYILFGHMLYIDSIQLVFSAVLYLIAIARVSWSETTCFVVVTVGTIISRISPLNLVLMSLERFVAVCFPLHHGEMSTVGRTRLCICGIWVLGSLDSLAQVFLFVRRSPSSALTETYCTQAPLFDSHMHRIRVAFTVVFFISSSVIIMSTYIAILKAAKSSSGGQKSKSNKTVLLHLVQLGLCLSSIFFYSVIEKLKYQLQGGIFLNVQYFLFMTLIICPRCLSPLIYGLRDQTFVRLFKYYFLFGTKAVVKPS